MIDPTTTRDDRARHAALPLRPGSAGLSGDGDSVAQALAALDNASRRMCDLARELDCLGFFDGGDDRPRAA